MNFSAALPGLNAIMICCSLGSYIEEVIGEAVHFQCTHACMLLHCPNLPFPHSLFAFFVSETCFIFAIKHIRASRHNIAKTDPTTAPAIAPALSLSFETSEIKIKPFNAHHAFAHSDRCCTLTSCSLFTPRLHITPQAIALAKQLGTVS